MNLVVPTIHEVNIGNTEKKIPHPTLTKIEHEPGYALMRILHKEMICNAISMESTFGWGG
jgi:hypothetical protein